LHSGRSLYTLIKPPTSPDETPEVHRIIMGHDAAAGEVSQLFVPGGWWKASEIPEEDRLLLDAPDTADLKERIGCLVSEIVVPGWNPDQHLFIDEDKVGPECEKCDARAGASLTWPSSRRCGAASPGGSHT
jgi:predicted cupin superfamily sugar epimerase